MFDSVCKDERCNELGRNELQSYGQLYSIVLRDENQKLDNLKWELERSDFRRTTERITMDARNEPTSNKIVRTNNLWNWRRSWRCFAFFVFVLFYMMHVERKKGWLLFWIIDSLILCSVFVIISCWLGATKIIESEEEMAAVVMRVAAFDCRSYISVPPVLLYP